MLYFAYGSNLSHQQMKGRCTESKYVQAHILKGYKLIFSHHNPNNISCAVVKSVCSDLDSSLIQRLIEQGSQSVMDSAQKTFTILQNKGNTGILIPRVRNHLFLSIVNLQVSFADHHDLVTSLASRFVQASGLYHAEETCLIDLVAGEADGGEWVINWLKQNAAKTDQQVLDKIQTPRR